MDVAAHILTCHDAGQDVFLISGGNAGSAVSKGCDLGGQKLRLHAACRESGARTLGIPHDFGIDLLDFL